jgi:hypothetical protein
MAEDHRLSAAPVLVINLRAVFGRDRGHGVLSFLWLEDVEPFDCLAISAIVAPGRFAAGYCKIGVVHIESSFLRTLRGEAELLTFSEGVVEVCVGKLNGSPRLREILSPMMGEIFSLS